MGELLRDRIPDALAYCAQAGLTLKPASGKWRTTRCDIHGGSDSLRINVESSGWCCMSCHAKGGDMLGLHMQRHALDFVMAARDLGAWAEDMKPDRQRKARRMAPADALEQLYEASVLVWVAAQNIRQGVVLTDADHAALSEASQDVERISQESCP